MPSLQNKLTGFVLTRRTELVWLALVGFFLGSAFCALNPPADDRQDSMKIGGKMSNPSGSKLNSDDVRLSGLAAAPTEMETATFALG